MNWPENEQWSISMHMFFTSSSLSGQSSGVSANEPVGIPQHVFALHNTKWTTACCPEKGARGVGRCGGENGNDSTRGPDESRLSAMMRRASAELARGSRDLTLFARIETRHL